MTVAIWLAARIRCLLSGHAETLRWTGGGNDGWTPVRVRQCRQCRRCGHMRRTLEVDL